MMRTFERVAVGHRISCRCSDCRATRGFHRGLRHQRVILNVVIRVLAAVHDFLERAAGWAHVVRRWVGSGHVAALQRRAAIDASLDMVVSAVRPRSPEKDGDLYAHD